MKFLEAARAVAFTSEGLGTKKKFRHGAILVRKNRVVASACNILKTHPALAEFTEFPFLHAESRVILKHGMDNCKGLDLYVVRITKNGEFAMSKPCSICEKIIDKTRISNVYYTDNEGRLCQL